MTKLSVIVPCYNCAETLDQAVTSIYRQDVGIPFDVTMVDDGSTDPTYKIMQQQAAKYSNIRLVRHATNQGGGAARNTAVANSSGDLIFCLDADDILGDGLLRNMTELWLRKRCDGIGLGKTVSFRGSDVHHVAYMSEFDASPNRVPFESFLSGRPCSLLLVFLITRKAFNAVGGYPTAHGFDTQGLGFRFLGNGLAAYNCPDAVYYHRVEYNESYYLREQSRDRLNWNWFHLLEEFLYLFNRDTQSRLLDSDLFRIPGRPEPPRLYDLVRGRTDIYASDYRRLLVLGRDKVARRLARSTDGRDQYWLGTYHASRRQFDRALGSYARALSLGTSQRVVYYSILEASLRLSGKDEAASNAINELALYCQPFPMERRPLRHRLVHASLRNPLLGSLVGWMNSGWVRLRDAVRRRRS